MPAELRRRDGILPGQEFEFERIEHGQYRLSLRGHAPNQGLVDSLLACPEKGFFSPSAPESRIRNGVPLLGRGGGEALVTRGVVNRLRDED